MELLLRLMISIASHVGLTPTTQSNDPALRTNSTITTPDAQTNCDGLILENDSIG